MNIENALELFYLKSLSALFFNRPFYCTAERLLSVVLVGLFLNSTIGENLQLLKGIISRNAAPKHQN